MLRMRPRSDAAPRRCCGLVTTLIASEVERIRAPERASAMAVAAFLAGRSSPAIARRRRGRARPSELGLDARRRRRRARRPRSAARAGRGRLALACAGASSSAARAPSCRPRSRRRPSAADPRGAEVDRARPGDDGVGGRAADGVLRELQAGLPGHGFTIGVSRAVGDPAELRRAGLEAELAANVADGRPERRCSPSRTPVPTSCCWARGPGRAAALLRRDGRAARRLRLAVRDRAGRHASRRSSMPTATSPRRRSGCSRTATRSATGWTACAS